MKKIREKVLSFITEKLFKSPLTASITSTVISMTIYIIIGRTVFRTVEGFQVGLIFASVLPAIISYPLSAIMISNHKKIKQQKETIQKQAEELKLANSTKDRFFSIIAHDLMSPFNVLIGLSDLLKDNVESYDKEELNTLINSFHTTSIQTYTLLDNLLKWASSQSDHIVFTPETVNIAKSINQAVERAGGQAKQKAVNLFFDDNTNTCNVFADKNMLYTILRNLLSNAIKFTGKGSISVNVRKATGFCELSITDTGVGMSKEMQSKLFDISKNSSTKGTAGESGTGLGLILCKEFVEKQGGKIWVESEENKGTKFTFTIPLS